MILLRFRRLVLATPLWLAVACGEGGEGASVMPPAQSSTPSLVVVPATSNTNWRTEAGPVLLAATGQAGDSGVIVLPEVTDSLMRLDSVPDTQLVSYPVELFSRGGRSGEASVSIVSQTRAGRGCRAWPAATVTGTASPLWSIGFARGRVEAIALDSIDGFPRADSAAIAAALARLAGTLPIPRDRIFRGLPFRVRSAYSFHEDSARIVIADIVRIVNQEASARVEHILLIAERKHDEAAYSPAYFSRTAGREETVQATEVLAAVRTVSPRHLLLVVSVDYGDGGKFGLLERVAAGRWKMTWKSAYTGC